MKIFADFQNNFKIDYDFVPVVKLQLCYVTIRPFTKDIAKYANGSKNTVKIYVFANCYICTGQPVHIISQNKYRRRKIHNSHFVSLGTSAFSIFIC